MKDINYLLIGMFIGLIICFCYGMSHCSCCNGNSCKTKPSEYAVDGEGIEKINYDVVIDTANTVNDTAKVQTVCGDFKIKTLSEDDWNVQIHGFLN